ncbi:ferritin family protein [Marinitoga lauensis]|uniref:ferritin family protein n=1 Tax=Marinitoga lauensis TaxID=2201189 RepID=UPI00101258F8|nr:ferritin family protein [Marinitoga lauensis]
MKDGIIGILNYALTKEIEGRDFYKLKMDSISNENLKEVFSMLVEMEQGHADYIKRLIEKYEKEQSLDIDFEENDDNLFEKRELKEITGGVVQDMTLDLSILKMAYLIEDDFMNFYKKAAEKVENNEAKELFKRLAKWEETHREILYSMYKELSDDYWTKMNFTPLY